jgi:hypothetical protein
MFLRVEAAQVHELVVSGVRSEEPRCALQSFNLSSDVLTLRKEQDAGVITALRVPAMVQRREILLVLGRDYSP